MQVNDCMHRCLETVAQGPNLAPGVSNPSPSAKLITGLTWGLAGSRRWLVRFWDNPGRCTLCEVRKMRGDGPFCFRG
jgi:hypothetical protein